MLIGLDLDSVVLDFGAGIRTAYKNDFDAWIPETGKWDSILEGSHFEDWDQIFGWLERDVPGFWENLPVMPGAVDGIREILEQGHTITVVTHRPEWATAQTLRSVHRIWPSDDFPDVVLTAHKQTVGFDVLIDDGPHWVEPVTATGREVIVFNHPWNAHIPESDLVRRAMSWAHVVELCKPPILLGLSGYAQSGKDTAAAALIADGWERVAFADVLRECLYALNPDVVLDDGCGSWNLRGLVDLVGWDKAKQNPEVRGLLQRLGTEVGRNILGENIWVETTLKRLKHGQRYVVTDVRFPNEADAIAAMGGHVWRIEREGHGPVNDHPSETSLDTYTFDATIRNEGSIEDYHEVVRLLAKETF